jgi:hypothetical protein
MSDKTQKTLKSTQITPPVHGLIQRRCACGSHTIAGSECDSCRKSKQRSSFSINQPDDAFEREADRIAEQVGNRSALPEHSATSHSLSNLITATSALAIQRQEAEKGGDDAPKGKEAAKRVGEAFLKTPLGEKIKQEAAAKGKEFIATLPGKVISGAAAAGAVSALIATNSELPIEIPEIPLDFVYPNLKMQITYEGPVRQPTKAMISFSGNLPDLIPSQPARTAQKLTAQERYQAETQKIAEDQRRFREGMKTPAQRKAEQDETWETMRRLNQARSDPLGLGLTTPGVGGTLSFGQGGPGGLVGLPGPEKNKLQFGSSGKLANPGKSTDESLEITKPSAAVDKKAGLRKREEEKVQRKARSRQNGSVHSLAASQVDQALASSGQPMEPGVLQVMERWLGYDLSAVRIHNGPQADQSARQVDALAYTVGNHIVFASGQYQPHNQAGRILLAHELVHTIQQGAGVPLLPQDDQPILSNAVSPLRSGLLQPVAGATRPDHQNGVASKTGLVVTPSGFRIARKESQGNPDEEEKKKKENKALKELKVVEDTQSPPPAGFSGKIRRFTFHEAFPLPAEKEKGPKKMEVEKIWQARAKAGALEAIMDVTGTPRSTLKQERDVTNELRASWLAKVGWPQKDAHVYWAKTGSIVKHKAEGFKYISGQGFSALFESTKVDNEVVHFDHIIELQIGGTNIKENIQVLDKDPNMASGRIVRSQLQDDTERLLAALVDRSSLENIVLNYKDVHQKEPFKNGPAAKIEQEAVEHPLKNLEAGQSSEGLAVEKYKLLAGGSATEVLIDISKKYDPKKGYPILDSPIVENKSAASFIPGLVLLNLYRKTQPPAGKKNATAKLDELDARLDAKLPGQDTKTRLPITLQNEKKSIFKLNVDPASGQVSIPKGFKPDIEYSYLYLSKGKINKLDWTPENGLAGEGTLKPDPPLLNKLNLKVAFSSDEFSVVAGLDPKKINPPIPGAKITQAELALALHPQFDPKGLFAFEYAPGKKKLLDGSLVIGKDAFGLMAEGKVNIYIPGVDAAEGIVKYSNSEWTGGARIAATQLQKKLKYVESGEVIVGINAKGIDASGKVRLAIPHTEGVEASLERRGGNWVFKGKGQFNPPRLDPVQLSFMYDGDHITASGKTGFTYRGLKGTLEINYYDEKISGKGSLDFEKGKAKGHLDINLSQKNKFSGQGKLSYQVTPKLLASAGIKLDEQEKLTLMGALVFTEPIKLFDPIKGDYTILEVGISIPIPGASIGPIGIKARIEGALKAGYQIGPGELQNARLEAIGNPLEENPNLEVNLSARLYIGARAYISGSISGGISLDVGLASATGGLILTASATLTGFVASNTSILYKQSRFEVNADFEALLALAIGLALSAFVMAEAGIGPFKVKTRKDWELASRTFDTGLKLGLKMKKPLHYASDSGFSLPSMNDIEIIKPDLDPQKLLKQTFTSAGAQEKEV